MSGNARTDCASGHTYFDPRIEFARWQSLGGFMNWIRTFISGLALVALSGCASVFLVDNQVQSFARWGERTGAPAAAAAVPQAPQVYRFDRLPSQRQGPSAGRAGRDSRT